MRTCKGVNKIFKPRETGAARQRTFHGAIFYIRKIEIEARVNGLTIYIDEVQLEEERNEDDVDFKQWRIDLIEV
jgi:hypothetical protein